MINRIIEFCAKNKFVVFLFVGVAVLLGWWSLQTFRSMPFRTYQIRR